MPQGKPNLLFIFPDQWRWEWLGFPGRVPVRTPHLDRLAKWGLSFDQVRCNSPICAPSRACVATARRYPEAGVRNNFEELDPERHNLFKALRDGGYQVLTTGKSDLHTVSENYSPTGWHDHLEKLGFTHGSDQAGKWRGVNLLKNGIPEAYGAFLQERGLAETYLMDMEARNNRRRSNKRGKLATKPSPLPRDACIDDYCGQKSLELLQEASHESPWFLWVNFPGPHEPFDPPMEYWQNFRETVFPDPIDPDFDDGEDHQGIRRNYAAMIEHIDHWIGRLLETIEQRGELEETCIVFTSDHGEMLGDHGKWYKSVPYEGSVHVPLIIAGPEVPRGERRNQLVELIDVTATLLEWAELDPLPGSDGKSLLPAIRSGEGVHRKTTISALEDWRMIFDGRYKLTCWDDGTIQLWDLERNPEETEDFSKDSGYTAIRENMLDLLTKADTM